MIPGVMVAMGGRDWTVPPLTLGQLRRLMPKVRQLTEIGAQMDETQIEVLVEIVAAALQRNYPDMTAETVENLLDLGNAGAVLHAVLTGSGLRPREQTPGEAAAPEPSPGADAAIPATSTMMVGSASMAPRHCLRLLLPRNRRDDASRGRGADTVLDRTSAAAPDGCRLSRPRQGQRQSGALQDRRGRSFVSGPLVSGAKPEVGAILAELGPRIAAGDVHAGFAPVVLDFAELKRTRRPTE